MPDQQTHPYPPTDPPSAAQSPPPPRSPEADSDSNDEPDRVVSDPVPVPDTAQTPTAKGDESDNPSDSDAPPAEDITDRVPDDALEDRGTFEDPVVADERTDPDDLTAVTPAASDTDSPDGNAPPAYEPAPQPTAFGAATVAGAAAAAAQAGPYREVSDAERDEALRITTPSDEPDRVTTPSDEADRTSTLSDEADRMTTPSDEPDRMTTPSDEPDRVTTPEDQADRVTTESDRAAEVDADRLAAAETPAETPAETRTETPADAFAETPAEDEPVVAGPETELLPGDVPAEPVTALWGDETAQSFRDRWRDVQLRFVDDPQGAAQEAKSLVADAVDSLTSALTSQRDDLSRWVDEEGNDTERFRVVVRQYRDFLDRLLGL